MLKFLMLSIVTVLFALNFITIVNSAATTTPTVTTDTIISNLSDTTATVGGNVTSDGGATLSERGICYATTANPTTLNSKVTSFVSAGAFTVDLSGLTKGTTYHIRAYATNSKGTSYGSDVSFTTYASLPTCTITASTPDLTNASNITYTFTFSESMTGFDTTDVTVTNGTKGTFSGSGTTYTLVVTNTGSCTETVNVAKGV